MPDHLANRSDMTLAQKQRLAVLARMGVGPVAVPAARTAPPAHYSERSIPPELDHKLDRKVALLERERRIREQEEQREEEERLAMEKQRRAKPCAGLARLGPVMPREEDIPQFLPAPAQEPEPRKRDVPGIVEKTVAASQEVAAEEEADHEEEKNQDKLDDAPPLLQVPVPKIEAQKRKPNLQEEARRKQGRKRKRKRTRDDDAEGGQDEEDAWEEEEGPDDVPPRELERNVARDGGQAKRMMVVESVKGKVSHANKNFTDADLERRFPVQESRRDGSLMTEEEARRMVKKEKQERGAAGSASRRVQRELAEWAAAKEQQRARVKSPHRFERMVVSRK